MCERGAQRWVSVENRNISGDHPHLHGEMDGDEDPRPFVGRGTRESVPDARAEEVSLLVHDLRGPLGVITLERDVVAVDLGDSASPTVRLALDRMTTALEQLDRLVSDVLDLASSDADRLALELEPCDLSRVIESAVDRLVPAPERTRMVIEVRAWPSVKLDVFRIERVMANLVGNAIKFAPPGSPIVIRIENPRGHHKACVSVIDQGPGLTDDQARQLFARFGRAKHVIRRRGHGLGLYISRLIVEAHGGRIGVESVPGAGSRFYFELPVGE